MRLPGGFKRRTQLNFVKIRPPLRRKQRRATGAKSPTGGAPHREGRPPYRGASIRYAAAPTVARLSQPIEQTNLARGSSVGNFQNRGRRISRCLREALRPPAARLPKPTLIQPLGCSSLRRAVRLTLRSSGEPDHEVELAGAVAAELAAVTGRVQSALRRVHAQDGRCRDGWHLPLRIFSPLRLEDGCFFNRIVDN